MNKTKATQARSWLGLSLCFFVLILSIFFTLQQRFTQTQTIRQYSETMTDVGFDTFVTYTETTDDQSFDAHCTLVKERFQHYNELFDYYHTYDGVNNLKTINDAAGQHAVTVDDELLECLSLAKTFYAYSDHFDVTQGSLLALWHTYREAGITANAQGEDGEIPSKAELVNAYNAQSWDAVEIDEEHRQVYISDPDVSIDLGGIAKGFAVQKVYEELCSLDVESAILNAGGNVMLIGEKSDQSPWQVGIQSPDALSSAASDVVVLSLNGSHAIVTSGDYQRYYEANGERYSHIIDPTTLYPATKMRSVSVVCDNSAFADCISTTLFTMSYEEGAAFLQDLAKNGIHASALWVFDEGTIHTEEENTINRGSFIIIASDELQDAIR